MVKLFHHRWNVPILAELHRGRGAKFVTLQHRLGASRGALRAALDWLIDCGWLARNPGYGHPMRPEYILTARGRKLAPACDKLWNLLQRLGLEDVGLRKWTLPVAFALDGLGRFNELKRALPGITARALTLALKALQSAGVVRRDVSADYPPFPSYRLTQAGRRLGRLSRSVAH